MTQPESTLLTTRRIANEIRNRPSIQRLENLLSTDRIVIEEVEEKWIELARVSARETGDLSVLSPSDLELLGLVIKKHREGFQFTLASMDFAVLNVASHIGVGILNPMGQMKHRIEWAMKCPACGHRSDNTRMLECDICGTRMKRIAKKTKRLEY